MKVLSYLICFMLLATFSLEATATEQNPAPIFFSHLTSPSENSALSGQCSGDTSSMEIDCHFVQTRIRYKLDPKELPKRIKDMEDELKRAKKDLSQISICGELTDKEKREEVNRKLKEFQYSAPLTYARGQELLSICSKPSYESIVSLIKRSAVDEVRTCKISSDPAFESIHLKKIGANKWLGTAGPGGLCNVVTTWTLEHEPNNNLLWTYTQIRVHADQTNEFCKALEIGKPLVYSWKYKPLEMRCDFIEFGM